MAVTKAVHVGLKHGPIEAMSTRFADALEVELRKLVERVEAAEGGVLRVTYEDSIAKAFFDAAHIAVFGPDLPATILGPFLRFDEAFPALAGLSNLPIPREISARLFAAKGDRAIKDLQRTLGRWIESGGYKSAPAGTQGPIDAMAEGGLSVADQAAGVIGLLLAVHCALSCPGATDAGSQLDPGHRLALHLHHSVSDSARLAPRRGRRAASIVRADHCGWPAVTNTAPVLGVRPAAAPHR